MKRYDVHWANLDPPLGVEMEKTLPVVIVSLDELNARLKTITICPLTSRIHPGWRSRLQVELGGKTAEIAVDQIRTISTDRIGQRKDSLSIEDSAVLRRIISEMYGE